MKIFSTKFTEMQVNIPLLLLRLGVGGMMLAHGFPKLQSLMGPEPVQFAEIMGMNPELSLILAVFAEFFCSILIILGLGTRLASIPLIITMLVAVFYYHAADPFSSQEMGLHYLLVYIVLLIMGSGRFSVDHAISKN